MLREIPSYAAALADEGVISVRAQGQARSLERLTRSARARAAAEVGAAQRRVEALRTEAWQEGYCDGFGAVMKALVPALSAQMLAEQEVLQRVLDRVEARVAHVLQDGRVYAELVAQTLATMRDPAHQEWVVYVPPSQEQLAERLQARVPERMVVKPGQAPYAVITGADRVMEVDPAAGLMAQARADALEWLTDEVMQGWADDFLTRARREAAREGGVRALSEKE
jgi:hypothetical protein